MNRVEAFIGVWGAVLGALIGDSWFFVFVSLLCFAVWLWLAIKEYA